MNYSFDVVFFRQAPNNTSWTNININGVGSVGHKFELPPDLEKSLFDFVDSSVRLKVAEIQANMTVKSRKEAV